MKINVASYLPQIDFLRAIAVTIVLGYHFFPSIFPGGFLGVDVFFIISGYLITSQLSGSLLTAERPIATFYLRRCARLLPAILFLIVVCNLLGFFILLPNEFKALNLQSFAALTFFSNYFFLAQINYFDPAAQLKPLLHMWSLSVEMQFYIFWPLVMLCHKRYSKTRLLIGLFAGSLLISLAASFFFLPFNYYSLFSRLWMFSLGALVFLVKASSKSNFIDAMRFIEGHPTLHLMVSLLCLFLILQAVFFYEPVGYYPNLSVFAVSVASAFLLFSKSEPKWKILYKNPVVKFVSEISYSLYLWHWPIFSIAYISIGQNLSTSDLLLLCALSVVIATVSRFAIERPAQKHLLKNV